MSDVAAAQERHGYAMTEGSDLERLHAALFDPLCEL